MERFVFVETYLGKNFSFPGTQDNPMRPLLYIDPNTGNECQAHYNDKNLQSDQDYRDAGLEYHHGKGWCVRVEITA